MRDARREGSPYPKADLTLRALARLADLTLAFAFANTVPRYGPPIAALYLLLADGLSQGQSIGKRIFGVRTMVLPPEGSRSTRGAPAGYRESILRNAAFGFVALFFGVVVSRLLSIRHVPPVPHGADALVGREGVVLGAGLAPDGVVRVASEEWRATSTSGPLPRDTRIRVTGLDGLVLAVEPLIDEPMPASAPAEGGTTG